MHISCQCARQQRKRKLELVLALLALEEAQLREIREKDDGGTERRGEGVSLWDHKTFFCGVHFLHAQHA